MKTLKIKVLRGPNYWSNSHKKLISLDIDLQDFEEKPSNLIPNFNCNLKQLLPSLYEHRCSEGRHGGFFARLEEGTWLGHVIEHVALELQWLAGMKVSFGRTRSAHTRGVYHVVFAYEFEKAGLHAAQASFDLVNALAEQKTYSKLEDDLKVLRKIYAEEKFGPSTASIIKEAIKRQIPYHRLNNDSLVLLGQGKQQRFVMATETSFTNVISTEIAADKSLTKRILAANHIPVPKGLVVTSVQEIETALDQLHFPLVIKPQDANHGKGVTANIQDKARALQAYAIAKQFSEKVMIEEYIAGADYRLLVINYQLIAAAKREPAKIIGDGISTIRDLIDRINHDPKRGQGHENYLTVIEIDEATLSILQANHLCLDSVLKKGESLFLKYAANISSGGTAEDVTDLVHPETKFIAERVARLVHLDICGIDIITKDISHSMLRTNGAVIEINSCPGFRMHLAPDKGKDRNVAGAVLNMLYPPEISARIPVVAVTGTNGKTTVVRSIAHLARTAGYTVGYTTTDGIYLNQQEIYHGDCSGPQSARVVLNEPIVDFAVFECARGGILRSGLGFDHCDISIVTNIGDDHLGQDDIETLEDLQRVKAVVPRSTFAHGYAILNADDDLVYAMKNHLKCHIALFALNKTNRLKNHLQENGVIAYVEDDEIIIEDREKKRRIAYLQEVPSTFAGTAEYMVQNSLATVLAGFLSGFNVEILKTGLASFKADATLLPGRMNIFNIDNACVMLDYAHNTHAFLQVKKYILQQNFSKKIGIIAATGDRRDVDIINLGKLSAEMFDEIIIRHDKDGRGRSNAQQTELLLYGIKLAKESIPTQVISDEFAAFNYALKRAVPNTLIFYFPEHVQAAIEFLNAKIIAAKSVKEATA